MRADFFPEAGMFAARLCFAEALDRGWLLHQANISISRTRRKVRPFACLATARGAGERVKQNAASAYGHGGFNPILDPRWRIIPRRRATLYGAPRVFVQPRFAGHAVFARIRSCLRNLFVISSLSFSFPLRKSTPRQKITGLSRGDSTFGSRDLAPNRLSSSHGVRCLRRLPDGGPAPV